MAPSKNFFFSVLALAHLLHVEGQSLRYNKTAESSVAVEVLQNSTLGNETFVGVLQNATLENENLFEGDMVVTYNQVSGLYGKELADKLVEEGKIAAETGNRVLGVMTRGIWTTRGADGKVVIPYQIDQATGFTSSNIAEIAKAMKTLEDGVLSIKFIPQTTESNYIFIQGSSSGCWSYVGKIGGAQAVNIGSGCVYEKTIIHELMHALSMFHEQSRPDRDTKVKINYENIKAGYESNFNVHTNINSLGSEYDMQSVMHYTATSFGKYAPRCETQVSLCKGVEIMFIGSGSDSNNPSCISASGSLAACTGQPVWNVLSDGNSVTFQLRSDQSKCFDGASLSTQTCTSKSTQSVQVHGSSLSSVRLRWEGDNANYIFPTSSTGLGFIRSASNTNNDFKLVVGSSAAPTCSTVSLCVFETKMSKTIEPLDGKSAIGGSGPSESDFQQLQLMYQCPGGARNMDNLCTEDCPCFEGQKSCRTDADCRGDLRCNSTAFCVPASSVPCAYVPETGKQYGTVQFGNNFEVNLNVKLQSINQNSWTNVFHVGEHAKDRIVSLFVIPNTSTLSIRIASTRAWNNNCDGQNPLEIGRSYAVRISVADGKVQTFVDGSLYCSTELNGDALGAPASKPLFVSAPGYAAADACLGPIAFTTLEAPTCQKAEKGKVLHQVTLGNTFVAKAVFTLNSINSNSWTNIFHVGTANYPRYASAFILPQSSTLSFRIASTTSTNIACTANSSLNLNEKYTISLVVGGEMARVLINSVEACSVSLPGNSPGVTNEPVYISSPYFEPADACIESVTFS